MKTEYLQYLIHLSQCKSISLAAEKCHISQQAFSAAIKQLEQELGVPLLIRTYQGVTFTPQGKETLAFAKLVLHHYEALKAQFQAPAASAETVKGNIQVFAGPAILAAVMYHFIPEFYQQYPQITLNIHDMEIDNIYTTIAECTESSCVGLVHTPLHSADDGVGRYHENLSFKPLFSEKMVACVSKYASLAKHKKLSVNTILKHPLVVFVAEDLYTNIIYNMLIPYGQPKINLTTGNPYLFFHSIAQDIGVGIVPATSLDNPAIKEALQDVHLIQLKENLHTTYGYLLPKAVQPSPALQAFVTALQNYKF